MRTGWPGVARSLAAAVIALAAAGAGSATATSPGDGSPPPPPVPSPALHAAAKPGITVVPLRHLDARAAALLMSKRRGGGLEGALAVGAPEGAAGERQLPYWIELRGSALAAGEVGERELQAYAYVLDERGEVSAFSGFATRLDLALCGERLHAAGARLHGTVALPATARTLRLLVREKAGAAFFLDEVSLAPLGAGAEGPLGLVLFPPAATEWLEVRAPHAAASPAATAVERPLRPPAARPVVPSPGSGRFDLIGNAALARVAVLRGRLVDARGLATPVADLEIVERSDQADGSRPTRRRLAASPLAPVPYHARADAER
jgi:hypothetical protein